MLYQKKKSNATNDVASWTTATKYSKHNNYDADSAISSTTIPTTTEPTA